MFISSDALVSKHPFNVDIAVGFSLVDLVNCIQDVLDDILS